MTYDEWIDAWLSRHCAIGMCRLAVNEMSEQFPELTKVPGFALTLRGRVEHWWLTDPDGAIVDPTAKQYEGGIFEYQPWQPGMEVRVGKCMNCGDDIYDKVDCLGGVRRSWCSSECLAELEEYYNG